MVDMSKTIDLKEVAAETSVGYSLQPDRKWLLFWIVILFTLTVTGISFNLWLNIKIGHDYVGSKYRPVNCSEKYQGLITNIVYEHPLWNMIVNIYDGVKITRKDYAFKFFNKTYNDINPVVDELIPIYVECNAFGAIGPAEYGDRRIFSLYPTRMENTDFTKFVMVIAFIVSWLLTLIIASVFIIVLRMFLK